MGIIVLAACHVLNKFLDIVTVKVLIFTYEILHVPCVKGLFSNDFRKKRASQYTAITARTYD